MFKVSLVVPSTVQINANADAEIVGKNRELVARQFSLWFGATETVGTGSYVRHDNGELVTETVYIVSSFASPEALHEFRDKVLALAAIIRDGMGQECVLVTIEKAHEVLFI